MNKRCTNCGKNAGSDFVEPLDDDLKETWQLSPALAKLFNRREGTLCKNCGVNARSQGLAQAILKSKLGYEKQSLVDWIHEANKHNLAVCEINSCQNLHQTLTGLNNLSYSEFGGHSHKDIQKLDYPDNQFDLVLHSETLEHVNNPKKAMAECRRVLKPEGIILFTVPIIWSRLTKLRTVKNKPSYHGGGLYLVHYEFGRDIDSILGVRVSFADRYYQNFVFAASKNEDKINSLEKAKLVINEKLASIGS